MIGRHGEETQNGNGRRFLGSCATNVLTIMNGYFEHKDIYKYMWECRGQGLRTIIDYFAVRKAIRPAVVDVKVIRGVETGSDHYLVNLRWSQGKKVMRNERNRLRLRKLMYWEEIVRFQTELGKMFEKTSDHMGEDVEVAWKEFKGAILAVTESVVCRQRAGKHRKATSWWSSDVKEAVKREKGLYRKALNDKTDKSWKLYKEAKKNAKQVVCEAMEKDLVREGKMLQKP